MSTTPYASPPAKHQLAPTGLTTAEVAERVRRGQTNSVPLATSRTYGQIVFQNVFSFYNNVLWGLGIALIVLGRPSDTLVVVGVALINVVVSLIQEVRAKRLLDHIALLTRPHVRVARDNNEIDLTPDQVVLGDILLAQPGDQFVADGTVLNGQAEVDESLLTGESDRIAKLPGDNIYSGAFCVSGFLCYRADRVGQQALANELTQRARIFRQELTPLQRDVNLIIQFLLLVCVFFEILVVGNAMIDRLSALETVRRSVVVISIIPVGLFLAISVAYALGAVRIAGHGALVQQANAIESLSHVDVLCLDKTGTLTTNQLEVTELRPIDRPIETLQHLLADYVASVTQHTKTTEAIIHAFPGEPTEILAETPFASERKWGAATLRTYATSATFVLGAPETLLTMVDSAMGTRLTEDIAPFVERGLRVVLFARSAQPITTDDQNTPQLPQSLESLGLIVLSDTLRPEATITLAAFAKVGVQVKIISGDHPATVAALAKQAGMTDIRMISGSELQAFDHEQFGQAAEKYTVFGRITPQQKERLVNAMRSNRHYVAMIGDGVNDVLSLKQAQVGIAMQSGSQATRSVADIILLHDTFAPLALAFREGQRIRNGLHQIILLFLTRVGFVALMLLAVVAMTDSFAFTPKQNSILAFITGGIPALALALWAKPQQLDHRNLFADVLHFSLPALLTMSVIGIDLFIGFSTVVQVHGENMAQTALTDFSILCGLALILYVTPYTKFWSLTIPVARDVRPLLMVGALLGLYVIIHTIPGLRRFFELADLNALQTAIVVGSVIIWILSTHLCWRFHAIERFFHVD